MRTNTSVHPLPPDYRQLAPHSHLRGPHPDFRLGARLLPGFLGQLSLKTGPGRGKPGGPLHIII